MTHLIGCSLIETVVKATISTGRVSNSDNGPLSILLISAPEGGKTSIVNQDCKSILPFSDITGRGITEVVKGNDDVTHLIILDMVAIMSHRQTVNNYTIAVLNAMTEEGIGTIAYPGSVESFPKGKRGLIACLTTALVKDGRSWWNKTGFATRLLPICYDHSPALIIKIKESITRGDGKQKPEPGTLVLPEKSIDVAMPKDAAREIQHLSDLKAVELQEKGYRRLKQFRALAKGHALMRNSKRPIVGKAEIDFLVSLMPYISFDKPQQI